MLLFTQREACSFITLLAASSASTAEVALRRRATGRRIVQHQLEGIFATGLFSREQVDLARVGIIEAADDLHGASVAGALEAPVTVGRDALEGDFRTGVTQRAEAFGLANLGPEGSLGGIVGKNKVGRFRCERPADKELRAIGCVDSHD
jgi:hypothetical protein